MLLLSWANWEERYRIIITPTPPDRATEVAVLNTIRDRQEDRDGDGHAGLVKSGEVTLDSGHFSWHLEYWGEIGDGYGVIITDDDGRTIEDQREEED